MNELLGGELHVRIVSGCNILDALLHRQRTLTSESRHLKVRLLEETIHMLRIGIQVSVAPRHCTAMILLGGLTALASNCEIEGMCFTMFC